MGTILSKKQMSEEDIKLQYITPAVTSKWDIHKIFGGEIEEQL